MTDTSEADARGVPTGDREALRRAWTAYCDRLRAEGEAVLDGDVGDVEGPQELAEALRAVARLGVLALQHRLDFNDPDFPTFFRALDDRYKYAGPDVHITYLNAPVRGDATYRITGNHFGRELNMGRLWGSQMEKAPDGSFEIIASATEHPGNWIALEPDVTSGTTVPDMYPMATGGVGGRTYYWDPDDDLPAGEFHIERIDEGRPDYPALLTVERLEDQLDRATALLEKMPRWWLTRAGRIREENQPNVVGPPGTRPPGVPGWNPPENSPLNYGVCTFDLGPDEALVLDSEIPTAEYWSFQLYNPWWESPDNQFRQTSVGFTDAFLDGDGRFRAVISAADPGTPNWLDNGGMRRGFLFYRWFRPTTPMPTPTGTVVPVADVRTLLPADHPVVGPAERRVAIARRRRWLAQRFQR